MILLRMAALFLLGTSFAFSQQKPIESLPIKLGDTYEQVKAAYQTPLEPEPAPSTVKGATQLRLKTKGVWFFFNKDGKIYTIRLESPFPGSIGGVRIGDKVKDMQKVLGKPAKVPSTPLPAVIGQRFVYYLDDITTAVFQANGDDEVEIVYLVK